MSTNSIHNAFINALLADATYVDLLTPSGLSLVGADLNAALRDKRFPPALAQYLGDQFEVVTQKLTDEATASGFDATVWREKSTGQYYLSVRGTEPGSEGDLAADIDLSLTAGLARSQVVDMVNWWLKSRAPSGATASQIKLQTTLDGLGISTSKLIAGPSIIGDGSLIGVSSMIVNGHSLGGHLATAFTRLFSNSLPLLHTYTYNSATFNSFSPGSFAEIAAALGLGSTAYPTNDADTNFRAMHGPDLTTQNVTTGQVGLRVDLFNEESTDLVTIPNHFMYKLTDALALGDLLSTLDSGFDISKLNTFYEASTTSRNDALEKTIDGISKIFRGVDPHTPVGDVGDTSSSRDAFHNTLATLRTELADFAGKVTLSLATNSNLATQARTDFGAFLSLNNLSPIVISTTDTTALAKLKQANETLAQLWEADAQLTPIQLAQGLGNFTDTYLYDRQALLQNTITANIKDAVANPDGYLAVQGTPGGGTNTRYIDLASGTLLQNNTALITPSTAPNKYVIFGDSSSNTINGSAQDDHLYGGAGADTLTGLGGADYEEGGAGFDTYQFDGLFGNDTLLDSDGQGQIKLGGIALTGGRRLAEGLWESDDKTILYSQQGADLAISLRSASASTGINGSITVKNWDFSQTGNQGSAQPGITQLGITLQGPATPVVPPVAATTFDLSTKTGANTLLLADTPYSTSNLLIHNAGAALDWGTPGAPALGSSSVRSGSGADVIEGGASNAVSNVIFAGGAGNDLIYANTPLTLAEAIARGDNPSTVALQSSRYALDGGAGADQIIGSDARDVIFGGAGDDTIVAGAGGDIIIADGNVGGGLKVGSFAAPLTDGYIVDGATATVGNTASLRTEHTGIELGQSATDSTGRRVDHVASPGTQVLNLMFSADFSALQNLNDTDIRGQGYSYQGTALTPDQSLGQHTSYLGSSIVGTLTTNREAGNDVIYAGAGDDVVNAGAGNDIVLAGDGNDMVAGYEGDDFIEGGSGSDVLAGDSFVSGPGAAYSSTPNINLYSAQILVNGYSLDASQHGQDYIDGGSGDDQIEGGGKADLLYGGEGDDVIFGDDSAGLINGTSAGSDLLDGGAGADKLFGGAGQDVLMGGDGADILVGDWQQDDFAGGDADMLDGGAGADVLYGGAGADRLFGGDGDDVLRGDATAVAIAGGLEVVIEGLIPMSAAPGDDFLDGGDGEDQLFGDAGRDTLMGGAGNDTLVGGDGDDTLTGGTGLDSLNGGTGDDTYVFALGDAVPQATTDTIYDTDGKNRIRLDGVALNDMFVSKSGVAGSQSWGLSYGLQTSADGVISGSNVILIAGGQLSRTIDTLEVAGKTVNFEAYVGQNMTSVMQTSATENGQYLLGGAHNDALTLAKNDGLVVAGRGNDTITLGGTRNVVKISKGDGDDVVVGVVPLASGAPTPVPGSNAILFGSGIGAGDVQVGTVGGGAVQIKVANGNASVTLQARGGGGGVSELRFADDASVADLAGLVGAYLQTRMTAGSDWVEGSLLADAIDGGAGDDVVLGYGGSDTLRGGSGADLLFGDEGDDLVDGGAGQDNLSGGEGNDTLVSDGVDYMDGGAGDDVYRVTLPAPASGSNIAVGTVNDSMGRNTLIVENGPQDLNQYAVFRKGGGTFLAVGRVGVLALGPNVDLAQFSVSNAAGDQRTLAAVVALQNPQGLVRSGAWSQQAGVQWTQSSGAAQILRGGSSNDWLEGGSGDDQLWGLEGDDRLTGGAGRDILVGGSGTNIYTFGAGDGSDVIRPTDGEAGVLQFDGLGIGSLRSSIVGQDLIINSGSADQVRIEGYASNAQLAANWRVVVAGQTTTLGAFALATDLPADTSLAARKQQFLDSQLTQLRTQVQYLPSSGWGDVPPPAVTQNAVQMVEGTALVATTYLSRTTAQTAVSHTDSSPIYEQTASPSAAVTYSFVSIGQFAGGAALPAGYREVQGPITPDPNDRSRTELGLIGYLVPNTAPPGGNAAQKVIGWRTQVSTQTITTTLDAANQVAVLGTAENDLVHSSQNELFRGVIETGQGNDSILLGSGNLETAASTRDTQLKDMFKPHGLGAWIDAGGGDDIIMGTDGDDVIIGGTGSDTLDGQSGADTYLITAKSGDVDHIKDTASIEYWYFADYGGVVNQDIVEFDSTVTPGDLSYAWETHASDLSLKTLALYRRDQLFLQVDYAQNQPYRLGAGVEQFKFSDGQVLSLQGLLEMVPVKVPPNVVNGTGAGNTLTGTAGRDVIYGLAGSDTIDGGAGADRMLGGVGNDTYIVDEAGDIVVELANEGTDLVKASVSYSLAANVENLTLTGTAAINATGNELANKLTGNAADNRLDGGLGADTMAGGGGNDTYVVDDVGDRTVEVLNGGEDTVLASVSYTLAANVENLILTGTTAIYGTGNSLANQITGNAANNTLNGGGGPDTLTGGDGNDTYIVNLGDTIVEATNGGTDTVKSNINWVLAANVENLTLTGSGNTHGTGNSLNNLITGNSGANTLDGGAGADTLIGGAGNDTYVIDDAGDQIIEAINEGIDTVRASVSHVLGANLENLILTGTAAINATGNELANKLTGNAADNRLDGGSGVDTLAGGAGNDTYVVDDVGDKVIEVLSEGEDTVMASVSFNLAANLENLILTGSSAINGVGNSLANTINGNAGDNLLSGGGGTDTLIGGDGNDTYIAGTGDTIVEAANGGIDAVQSNINWVLEANVENLSLTGSSAIKGTGNTLDNVLTGNSAANTLTGNAGNDTLDGKAGADLLIGGTGNDTYWLGRGWGNDTIQENDATAGNTDIARFDAGIATDQLWFHQVANNLEVSIIGTSDKFTLSNWYTGSATHVEQFKTSNGKTLLDSQVQSLVSAMAAFSPPAAGQTTLPASYATTLATVIAANWV